LAQKRLKQISKTADHVELAYDGIRMMLLTNEILPGRKISYRQLAEKLDMSLTPVIQALKRLEYQGLVRHEPNRGYFTEPMSLQEVQEIYDMREILETSLLPDVMKNLDQEGIHRLRRLVDAVNTAKADNDLNTRIQKDREFHLTLAEISGKRIAVQILHYLFDLLYLKYSGSLLFAATKEVVGAQHQAIFEAVISQELSSAQKAMVDHFRDVKGLALKTLGRLIAGESAENAPQKKRSNLLAQPR
jgi:DNA-binding GntR family transcriptional regulator